MPSSRYNFTKEHMNHPMSREKMYPAALCYQGATARAIEQVANANGYVIVNKSLGYDLYLVRRELWRWPVPKLEELQIEKCMNAPMSPQMAVNLLDYGVYSSLTSTPGGGGGGGGVAAGGREAAHAGSHHGRSGPRANLRALCKANREAAKVLARLATTSKCGCFKHMAEPLPESEACRALAGLPADTRSGGYYHGERPWENRG